MNPALKVGMVGLGTVGQGILRVLASNGEEIARRAGRRIEVLHIAARDLTKHRDCELAGASLSTDPLSVVRADVDVVVEVIGGLDPAEALIAEAIGLGRHVVTANKALLAERGTGLFEMARRQGSMLAFEAAVAGGIPIIKVLREGLAANRINEIAGIINGTSNYILTQMREQESSFSDALAQAQKLGYAEADPTFDVEGIDAAHKLCLLAGIAFGTPLAFSSITAQGIGKVQAQDIGLASELGYRIKSMAIAKRSARGIELRVHPTLVPVDHLLAKIDGVLNAILVDGDAVGQTVYVGRGAGAEATASSVIADLVDIARLDGAAERHWVAPLGSRGQASVSLPVVAASDIESAHYLRLRVADERGVLRSLSSILAEAEISIEAILQKEPKQGQDATIAIITSSISESRCAAALARMQELPFVRQGAVRLKVEYLE